MAGRRSVKVITLLSGPNILRVGWRVGSVSAGAERTAGATTGVGEGEGEEIGEGAGEKVTGAGETTEAGESTGAGGTAAAVATVGRIALGLDVAGPLAVGFLGD